MHVRRQFHRSVYLTLGMACACLGYAELAFLPEITGLAIVVAGLLVVAYRLEGRWALSLRAANVLGGFIGVGALAWVAYQFVRPWGGTLLDQLPWPTSLLPYLGPLLMILIPAKLFRPKHEGDIWGLHGIGLIAVALGCALAGDPVFAVMLVVYLVCLMWSLTLFYFYREQQGAGAPAGRARWADPPRALGQSGRWAAAVTTLAIVVFLLTPRSGDARWQLTLSGRLQTGISEDRPSIDLNNSGTLSLNREVVFSVRAVDALNRPVAGLDPTTRWRGTTFNHYENGRWEDRPISDDRASGGRGTGFGQLAQPTTYAQLPALGPRQIVLTFHPSNRFGNPNYLAEPVWHQYPAKRQERVPVVSVFEGRGGDRPAYTYWYLTGEYELRPPMPPPGTHRLSYKQVIVPPTESGLGPPVDAKDFYRDHLKSVANVPSLKSWTADLLRRLAERKMVPTAAVPGADRTDVQPDHSEAVARALTEYMSTSGEYKYTLNLQRQDPSLDPVEDFLYVTRRGHCNRFSTALALMLRSQGIPTRVVLGYRGADEMGDGKGEYEVRHSHAHSWVEALIPRPGPAGKQVWHWLTLDATPSTEDNDDGEFQWGRWWDDTRVSFASMFKNFIIEYDSDQQDRTRTSLGDTAWGWLVRTWNRSVSFATRGAGRFVVLAGVAGLALWQWRRRTRATGHDPAASLLDRLLAVMRRVVGKSAPGRTPRELAEDATGRLRAAPTTVAFADLPAEAVEQYYRARYGREPLDPAAHGNLIARLSALERAVSGLARPVASRPSAG